MTIGAPQFGWQAVVPPTSIDVALTSGAAFLLDPAGEKSNATFIESAVGLGDNGAEPCATAGETDSQRMDK
jgi:hypothetical protein